MLVDNGEINLTPQQVEFAKTIHSSGTDLLALINDILDLSKIESGTIEVNVSEADATADLVVAQRVVGHETANMPRRRAEVLRRLVRREHAPDQLLGACHRRFLLCRPEPTGSTPYYWCPSGAGAT